jgi:hypothetical protein
MSKGPGERMSIWLSSLRVAQPRATYTVEVRDVLPAVEPARSAAVKNLEGGTPCAV